MARFHGIEIYEILENGNLLNAIYTNTGLLAGNYAIDNEIARKDAFDSAGVIGTYNARYIETNNRTVTECTLVISRRNEVYDFIWRNNEDAPIWIGIGLKAGNNHIAVSYIEA